VEWRCCDRSTQCEGKAMTIFHRERVQAGVVEGQWWHRLDDGRIQCDLCPRECKLNEGQRGFCFVRQAQWRDPADWTGLNCSSASFWLVFSARVSCSIQWKVDNKPESRLIHNRPGPVRCENAWYRSVTSQQCAGPEKGDCG
jgi:hypothetical protein